MSLKHVSTLKGPSSRSKINTFQQQGAIDTFQQYTFQQQGAIDTFQQYTFQQQGAIGMYQLYSLRIAL